MKRPADLLFTACLATMVAGAGSGVIAAAEGAVAAQDLMNVREAGQVTASWTRQPGFYALQVVMDPSRPRSPGASMPASRPLPAGASLSAEEMRQRGMVNVAEELKRLVPQNIAGTPAPDAAGAASPDRASFFIGNTIANLRGLDLAFGCRTLTLVDGRRTVGEQAAAASARPFPLIQSYPPVIKHPRIEVWLLKADGTQIVPEAYICVPPSGSQSRSDEFTYRYSAADGAQAVAAAIRIDSDFYIEKLQALEAGQ